MTAQNHMDLSRPVARPGLAANIAAGLATVIRPARAGMRRAALAAGQRRLAILAALSVAPILATMIWIDRPLAAAARTLPPDVIGLFREITDFGKSAWILVPLGVLLAVVTVASSARIVWMARGVLAALAVRLGFLFIAVGLPGLFDTVIKRLIGRARPSDLGPFSYHPFAWEPKFASLPSGHSTTAFAALVAFGVLYPRWRPLLWAYALAIAASRIIVSAHYPSDVLAGAVFGVCGAILVRDWFAARRLGFQIGADGAVSPMPGPSWGRIKRVARAVAGQ